MADLLHAPLHLPDPADPALTPAMRQYVQFKTQHPDYVLFFRMGDFYEMFWDDARLAHRVLGISLTTRSKDSPSPVPMAGVPFHALEGYVRRMIASGHRVAICEQTEAAGDAKGVIRREVTRLMTPGTLTDDPLLESGRDNFLAALAFGVVKGQPFRTAMAWVDLSTGQVAAMSDDESRVLDELARLGPAEVLIPEMPSGQPHAIGALLATRGVKAVVARPGWQFTPHHGREMIQKHWQAKTSQGFGFTDDDPANFALGAVLSYLDETQKSSLAHLRTPRRHTCDDFLAIDPATYRSLEIDRTTRGQSTEGSLLAAIDRTRTSMGARLLRQWVRYPLCDIEHIAARQNAIAALMAVPTELSLIVKDLDGICDIERIIARVAVGRVAPRDLASLSRCLLALPGLLDRVAKLPDAGAVAPDLHAARGLAQEQAKLLQRAILPDPAPHLREGGVIATGYDAELDRLRNVADGGQRWLAEFQAKCVAESNIASLKVGYNRVFGYYIEVTESHRDKVPAAWSRKQTLKGAERYVTPELKEFEHEALGARDKAIALEQRLFEQLRQQLLPAIGQYQELAAGIARLDTLCGLASLALDRRYCRPQIVEENILTLIDARHPVLEQQLDSRFVSNDLKIVAGESLILITGPNMAGKSTFIRQAALIVLLAQIGSYVPAKTAVIGLADRVFARIGASDELHNGQSTFMVEMTETANILNNATGRSLVVLDEIGRGTSTLDGLSLAWAIAEHISGVLNCRTLFATHYHELTNLAERSKSVRNLNVAVREWEDQVIFLHRIVEGGADRSYGIHVARLAGVPAKVLGRAKDLLGQLAVHHAEHAKAVKQVKPQDAWQMYLFDGGSELVNALKATDLDQLTPVQAFDLLREWKGKFGK